MVIKQIPHAHKVIIPDAGHHPNMEQPALFNCEVEPFLANQHA
jgi:pimeloyl-ACP methyl ester carboxylesterase